MSRTLSADTIVQKNLYATTPINIVRIDWPSPTGTKYYSDRDLTTPVAAEGRVVSWSSLDLKYQDGRLVSAGKSRLSLRDEDGVLRQYVSDYDAQRTKVTVYQFFAGLSESDLVPLLVGVMATPVKWEEHTAVFHFCIDEIVVFHDQVVGTTAARELFPDLPVENEGRMLPLVFGKARRVPALLVRGGGTSELAKYVLPDDEEIVVTDARHFPQGESIRIRIGTEEMLGSFDGNKFNVTQRGANVATGTTTSDGERYALIDTNLDAGNYVGSLLKVTLTCNADSSWTKEYRTIITGHDPATGKLYYFPSLWNPDVTLGYITIPSSTSYTIGSASNYHKVGATISEINSDGFTYIASDAASKGVKSVEVWASGIEETWFEGKRVAHAREGWITIPPELYTVNANDTSTFPSVDHAITTITFARPVGAMLSDGPMPVDGRARYSMSPSLMRVFRSHTTLRDLGDYEPPQHTSDEIRVTLEGVETGGDGSGDLIEEPLHICHTILSDERFMNIGSEYINSYDPSWSGDEPGTVCAFHLSCPVRGVQLVQDIAFQGMRGLRWSAGTDGKKITPTVLHNGTPESPVATVSAADVKLGTIAFAQPDQSELVTEIIARFSAGGEPRSYSVRDSTAELTWGRRTQEIDLWAYDDFKWVQFVAAFYLNRWKHLIDEASLEMFLGGLELEVGDTVELDLSGMFGSGQKARVIEVSHHPGSGVPSQMDRVGLKMRLWRWPGCGSNGCQGLEETGCASRCQLTCTTSGQPGGTCWTCQTSCQYPTMIGCMSGCQLYSTANVCRSACMYSCTGSCTSSCQKSCQASSRRSGDDPSCETSDTVTGNFGRAFLCELSSYSAATQEGTVTEVGGDGRSWTGVPLYGGGQPQDDDYVVLVFRKPVEGSERPAFVMLPSRYES